MYLFLCTNNIYWKTIQSPLEFNNELKAMLQKWGKLQRHHIIWDCSEMCWNGPLVVDLSIFILSVARRLKTKEKQKKRKAYEPKLTPEGNPFTLSSLHWIFPVRMKLIKSHLIFFFPHSLPEMMDSSTFKRFSLSIDNIFENLEDVDFTAQGRGNISVLLL